MLISDMTRREFGGALLAAGQATKPSVGLAGLSLHEASELVRKKSVSPVELTRACLERIERYNPILNAFITVTADQALAEAREREAELGRGRYRGPLHGIPVALKDLINTAGVRTTAASALFKDRVPNQDAEVVRRLKAAGAILLGKLNLDEFAYNFTSETSHFGPVHNPWKLDRIPGGSSGGSAAAVAATLCYAALGSDTGGSIRFPAACCGITGLMATYGRVSTRGVVPLAWSLDHVGPMCRSVRDVALVVAAIAGHDPEESTSLEAPVPDFVRALEMKTNAFRVGIVRRPYFEKLDPEVEGAVNAALDVLRKLTAEVDEVELPPIPRLPVLAAEASAFHATYLAKSPQLYHPWTRAQLEEGLKITTPAYIQGRHDLARLRREVRRVFTSVDVLATPTTPLPSVPLDSNRRPDLILLRNTIPFNIYGLPGISVPCGFTPDGLPVGLQLQGPPLGEERLLALAQAYERATEWHKSRPPLPA